MTSVVATIKCDLAKRIFWVRELGVRWSNRLNMPSDIVSLAVSTGLGFSVLAGIVSGVCYIFAHGVQKKRNRKLTGEWYCEVCGAYLRSIDGILEGSRVVTCTKCQKRVCKTRCSTLSNRTGWICNSCLRPPESWFQGILNAMQPKRTVDRDKMNLDSLNEIEEDIEALRRKEKEKIRDFIEKLVNAVLGEDVDDAKVSKMYNDKEYIPLTGQSPCNAHTALKVLIERLLQETSDLPRFEKTTDHPASPENQTNRTYEDLLATAIINKVVGSSQNRLPSSSAASVSSRLSTSSRHHEDKEYFFGDETLESKWKTADPETTSVSSIEEWLYSDSSFGSKKYIDKVTLTIKQDIEEVSQTDSENEEDDDSEYFRSKSSLFGDEEANWFLQKRQFQGTNSPVPVPMLVPKPSSDAKVLIGDKEVDETSDLSDVQSDYGEVEAVHTRQSLLITSKKLIGGKSSIHNVSDGESSADSGVKEVDRDKSGYDDPIFEDVDTSHYNESAFVSKADITVDDDNVEDASILSIYSNTEKEAEYTEKYASLPRTILKTPTPPSRPSLHKTKFSNSTNLDTSTEVPKNEDVDNDEDSSVEEFSGSYSKREKEKWKHAVEMKNNPYSKENIEKRIKKTKNGTSSLFGPDYYARQAGKPSGARINSPEVRGFAWTRQEPDDSDHETNEKILIEAVPYAITVREEVTAEPVITEPEEIKPVLQTSIMRIEAVQELTVSEYTSESDISYVNYYDVEKSEISKKTKDEALEEEPTETVNPLISDYNHNGTDEDKIEIVTKEVPIPKERPRYIKLNSPYSSTLKISHTANIRRHKSESDLLEDSLDAPPRVISKKKDNTLISKIYSQPHVRNFALASRKQVPVNDAPTSPSPVFMTQRSLNETTIRYNGKSPLYHSDDGTSLAQNGKKSHYSSEEDLLESNSSKDGSLLINGRSYETKSKTICISDEEDVFSEHSSIIGHPTKRSNSKTHLYSSSEDLLSIEEHERPHRKKDNTLIEKIYQNKNVRDFVLSSRDYIPVPEEYLSPKRKFYHSSEDELTDDHTKVAQSVTMEEKIRPPSPIIIHKDTEKVVESPPTHQLEEHERHATPDPEIDELAKKKIVHSILEQYSVHKPELAPRSRVKEEPKEINNNQETEDETTTISVKELRKKFENNDGKNIVISSLTARSLSKQIRENWKK